MTISMETILLRLFIALILGAIIGLEREYNEHTAGIRTNALVALGTTLFTIISAFGFLEFTRYPHIQVDPSRIASYIVAGIGFLGGGAIYIQQNKQQVKGLTTAACIWVVAAIGMACGIGLLWEAAIATAFTLATLIGLRYIEAILPFPHSQHQQYLYVETQSNNTSHVIAQIYETLHKFSIQVDTIEIRSSLKDSTRIENLIVVVQSKQLKQLPQAIDCLKVLPEISAISIQIRKFTLPKGDA